MTTKSKKGEIKNFSVLMAVYKGDNANYFQEALDSIYTNTITPNELILVVDGPISSELQDVIKSYEVIDGFKVFHLPENKGLSTALNYGLSKVSNELVFRADADDINLKNRFESQIRYLEDNYDIVGSTILEITEDKKPLKMRKCPVEHSKIVKTLKYRSPFNHMTIGFKKSIVLSVGGYPNISLKEDYALWIKLLSSPVKALNLDAVLVHARAGKNMYQRRGGIKYFLSEIQIQTLIINNKLNTFYYASFIGVCRGFVFLMPNNLRGLFYSKFLRK